MGEWGAGQRERLEGATRSAQASAPQRLAAASAVSCPPALHSPRLSLGHRAPEHSATCKSERSRPPLRGLHTPRYITRDREEPAAASALPPLGLPRPRAHPAPGPAPSPPARRPPNRGGAAPLTGPWLQPPALLAPPFAVHAPCRGVSRPPPAKPDGRQCPGHPPPAVGSSLVPDSSLWLTRGLWAAPPAIRRCRRQPCGLKERREGPQQRGNRRACLPLGLGKSREGDQKPERLRIVVGPLEGGPKGSHFPRLESPPPWFPTVSVKCCPPAGRATKVMHAGICSSRLVGVSFAILLGRIRAVFCQRSLGTRTPNSLGVSTLCSHRID